jgi:integrase
MKARKEHVVPLSQAALGILESLPREDERVFPGLVHDSMRDFLKRHAKANVTVHGFRSAFADWATEETTHDRAVVQMALAHSVGDKIERAYRRGDMRTKRFALMDDWALFCGSSAP